MATADVPLIFTRDVNGYNSFGITQSKYIWNATITAAHGETHITVPSTSAEFLAVFSYQPGASVLVAINNTAALPAGATLTAATSELNPASRQVNAGDTISMITADTADNVSISLLKTLGQSL